MYFKFKPKDIEIIENCLPKFTIEDLVKAGAHFGHKAARWNFEMSPYIFGTRNGMHIINLKKTHYHMTVALLNLYKEIKSGNTILFVATNPAVSDIVKEFALKCNQPYVTHRWLGGMLTNWRTIVISIRKIKRFEKILSECNDKGRHPAYSKKEIGVFTKELSKLKTYFDGLRNVTARPDNIIVFDSIKDDIAIKEAVKLCIAPTVLLDTNCSTKNIDYLIPCNNDSRKTVKLIASLMCDTVLKALENNSSSAKSYQKKDQDIKFSKGAKKTDESGDKKESAKDKVLKSSKAKNEEVSEESKNIEAQEIKHDEQAVTA